MRQYGYFNGKIITNDKIKISPYDIGLLRGYGVFDVMRTRNGKPFLLAKHWKRLQNSAQELNLKIPILEKEFAKIIRKLLEKNKFQESTIRTVLTGGESSNGFSLEGKFTFFILIEQFNSLPKKYLREGVKVITTNFHRNFPQAKITNHLLAIKMQKERIRKKAYEIIYTYKNLALEATTSNLFIVRNDKIITAKEGILPGITRGLVLDLAKREGLLVIEKNISVRNLFSAQEVFLTASSKDILPVREIDGKKVGDGQPGEKTKILIETFQKFVKNY